ncbi:hypothetical protein [Acetobacter cibinongensis]|uniref:Uncharacterized protein n=1 Tax=Acetobacter cibinongensis TaxID=146475 RepID=A0A1Z5YXI1_9PROT|nr:hypothetical protein [Acetobacter cibinongensis]OUJ03990.1 hypothetical protein HK14_14930 [Acetobacter cibinongensis]GAN59268.1 hypothetical protein Abci_003_031 [Acetobacter cibinongensis]GBQ13853.1 hypothetical protein AA0482_0735 [Acetobacter cibinongensis NRIC 0482]GEL59017.1 hypothetical protein ACI01nite_16190 [Acetobacter cibinongensis]
MTLTNAVTSAASQVGDFLTFATQDESGLLSLLNDILGPLPQPGHPSKLERRAEHVEMLPVIRGWQAQDKAAPATEEQIRQFFTPEELATLSKETGLSETATMSMVQELLPRCVRRRALHEPFACRIQRP